MINSTLTYITPGWWPWAAACFLVIAAASGWICIRRPHPVLSQKSRTLLWGLRTALGLLLLVFILDWRVNDKRETVEKPMIRVLIDQSASMATRDAPGGESRFKQASDLLASTVMPLWHDDSRISVAYAGSGLVGAKSATPTPDAPRSALGRSLHELLNSSGDEAVGAVILFSDGAASDPEELKAAADQYRTANIPVYPWLTGTREQPADVRILSASLRQPSPSQPGTHLEMTVESPGYSGKNTELTIAYGGQTLHQQTVSLNGGEQQITADFISPHLGCHFYDIRLKPLDGEA
ncbi:MAG TPA: vWA domain-containing protein, partial [Luteolibacter sp.]